jgi:hypothetical protein
MNNRSEKPETRIGPMLARSSSAYDFEKDGPLGDYLYNNSLHTFPVFNGSDDYEDLKAKNLLTPGVTMLRVVWGSGNDEFYNITVDFKLEGVTDIDAHAGLPGVHDPKDILNKDYGHGVFVNWELHSPNLETVMEMQNKGM